MNRSKEHSLGRPRFGRRQPERQGASGFTATDLIVVLSVLSVLAAVVVPLVNQGRQKARLTQCTANLQQVARAVLLYAEDHKGRLPALADSPQPGGWWHYRHQVAPYIKSTDGASEDSDGVFGCPSDRGYGEGEKEVTPFRSSERHQRTSYVFNGVTLPGVPHIAGWNVTRVREPDRTLSVMEWTAHGPLSWHNSRTGKRNAPFYNEAESVVGFVDGHVDFIKIYYDGINPAYSRDPIQGYKYRYSGE